jgi:hypothetical protein
MAEPKNLLRASLARVSRQEDLRETAEPKNLRRGFLARVASEEDLPEAVEPLRFRVPMLVASEEELPEMVEPKNLRRVLVSLKTYRNFLSQGDGFMVPTT